MITMKEEIAVDTWKAAVVVTMVVNVNNRKNIIDDCALVSMHTQHFVQQLLLAIQHPCARQCNFS